jgi:glucan phosphoethanolaminetransferase (alkaline phosphatase superfamily)
MAKNKNKEMREQAQKTGESKKGEFSLKDYFYINLFFWAFLVVIAVLVFITTGSKWDPIMGNMFSFIFLVFGCGFTAVSAFDYIYERIAKKNENKQ